MSYLPYPPDRYLGEGGEASATVRLGAQAPELDKRTSRTSYLATGETTPGMFGLYRGDFKGPPSGPDPHFHRSLSESFYVLSGTIRLYDGRTWVDGTPRDYLYAPERGRAAGGRPPGRLPGRPGGGHPRIPQRVGRAGLDAHPVRAGRTARGLLR